MHVTRVPFAAAAAENAPVEGVTVRDTLGLVVVGVLITVLWLAFRRLKQLADQPDEPKKPPR